MEPLVSIFNENLGLVTEWFSYGFVLGVSTKPLKNFPMTVSLYATDLTWRYSKFC